MVIVNQYNFELEQLNVKTTFLHGDQEETIYVEQHENFVKDKAEVYLLKNIYTG